MKEYKINLTHQFLEELDKVLYFFSYSYLTRRKIYNEVRNIVLSLSIFPERYSQIKEHEKFRTENIRKLSIDKFIIIYEVDNTKNEVYVLHIFSEKQDYLNLL